MTDALDQILGRSSSPASRGFDGMYAGGDRAESR